MMTKFWKYQHAKLSLHKRLRWIAYLRITMRDGAKVFACQILALVFLGLLSTTSFGQEPVRAHWQLLKGKDPVCTAYTRLLNESTFPNYPHCDRLPDHVAQGFSFPKRIPLAPSEVAGLADPVLSFLATGEPNGGSDSSGSKQSVNGSGNWLAGKQTSVLGSANPLIYFYRLDPKPDIDNDGDGDDVIVWKSVDAPCGAGMYKNGDPMFSPIYLLALSSDGHFDARRTQSIFGHPKGHTLTFRDPHDQAKTISRESHGFRGIGNSFGLFRYLNVTYFDTFYAPGGDLAGARDGAPGYLETLAVLRNRGGRTALVCEIRASNTNTISDDSAGVTP